MSQRIERIESTLARAVQQVIARGLHDPRAGGLISVTSVSCSPDLSNATVFISVYPEDRQELTLHALRHAARHIRREAGELMSIQKLPELSFKVDMSLKKQAELMDALAKARAAGQPGATPPDADAPGQPPANSPISPTTPQPRPGDGA